MSDNNDAHGLLEKILHCITASVQRLNVLSAFFKGFFTLSNELQLFLVMKCESVCELLHS